VWFFERREAKAETTFSRANALLHITFTFFETRETQHETRARSFAHIWCFLVVARSCVHRMGIQSHVFAVALHTSTRHASFESVDDVIVFRLVPDTPERLPERPASLLPRSARLDGEVHVIFLLHLVHGVHVGGAREPEQRARDEVVAWRALARPVVGRQVVQTHAVFALALRHRARARVLPDLSDCGSLRRVRPSATRPRATRCGRHRSARGFFALDSKPSAAHFFFSRTRRDASRALARTSAVKRSSC
jgi:hypothetical protein